MLLILLIRLNVFNRRAGGIFLELLSIVLGTILNSSIIYNAHMECMRIFKIKEFNKWANNLLTDDSLLEAANEIADGVFEASLGQKVYKKRIALEGAGKSGGTRTIAAYQEGNNLFFMYGFEKGSKANITKDEKKGLQKLAKVYFSLSTRDLNSEVKAKRLVEIKQKTDTK